MGMKRIVSFLLAAAVLLFPAVSRAAYDYESIPTPNILVVDADDLNHVFYERAADTRAFPASTTKIMTCLLAVEAGNFDESVTVGEEVTPFTNLSSLMGLKSGETVTMRDLVYGLMLVSGNDAASAIAVHVAGSVSNFVDMMNRKAQEIGMTSTHFTNPHGVQDDNHYTTARDMAKLMAYAMQNETFCQIDRTLSYTVAPNNMHAEPVTLVTTNRLMRAVEGDPVSTVYPYAVGGKTGDTNAAGKCLVAVAERDGARVIIVLFGDRAEMYNNDSVTNNLARFLNAAAIFTYVFDNEYAVVTAQELNLPTAFQCAINGDPADLTDGKMAVSVDLTGLTLRAFPTLVNQYKANAAQITADVQLYDTVSAPIAAGDPVGQVTYSYSGKPLFTATARAVNAVRANLSVQTAPADTGEIFAPTATPLIDKGRRQWSASDFLVLTLVLLIVLLVALIVVFIITERKRRFERKRRQARMRRRQ